MTPPDICKAFPMWEKEIVYKFKDIEIVLEYLEGDIRTKTMGNGSVISNTMPAAYGRILNTNDIHGEEIDMYVASMPDEDAPVYVIDQINPGDNTFDEHKVMLGFSSLEEAVQKYMEVFSDGSGSKRLGDVTTMSFDVFYSWLNYSGATLLPASKCPKEVCENVDVIAFNEIKLPPNPNKPAPKKIDEVGGVIVKINPQENLQKIFTKANDNGGFDYTVYLYTALTYELWGTTVDMIVRTLDLASENDSLHIHIISPGGSVVLLGRLLSAIDSTKAKVHTYAEGEVCSAATSIWAAGHERYILPGAFFMQHMSSQMIGGKTSEIEVKARFCADYVNTQLDRIVKIGLFTKEDVMKMNTANADIFISGDEAILRTGQVEVMS